MIHDFRCCELRGSEGTLGSCKALPPPGKEFIVELRMRGKPKVVYIKWLGREWVKASERQCQGSG